MAILYPRSVVSSVTESSAVVGKKRVFLLHLEAVNELRYSFSFWWRVGVPSFSSSGVSD